MSSSSLDRGNVSPAHPAERMRSLRVHPSDQLTTLLAGMHDLVRSTEPESVFTSAAELSSTVLCDVCTVSLVLAAQEPYQVTRPAQRADLATPAGDPDELHPRPQLSADSVIVPIRPQPIDGMPSYHGVFVLAWDGTHRPTQVDVALAQLIVDRACAIVHDTRLATLLARERERAKNLEIALESNREIGTAIGILMARELLTSTQAFDQLRQVSQNTHRKLRAVAGDVILTGKLDPSIGCAEAPGLRLALVEPDGHEEHDEHRVPGRAPE